ncbi:SGNH/GDSL hydrolase family protein [Streptomyces sp. NBC_00893]|uniref:SGNH/GDSL hydrolase family protein n=1 Tax=Streptomyces sp. NBC_00893 TaxID=2975862 RepID=UPI0022592B74|nr:SGNH/GDSL hydrolase family protein [Streptomyces sp. NBC_00893]MCX4851658.1 SGNH/GDSL hydrolase family protein [Streptomyces sp. NBC_00893]
MKLHTRALPLALVATTAALGLTACQDPATSTKDNGAATTAEAGKRQGQAQDIKPRRLLWMGDSIGEAEAPALGAAIKAGGAEFTSMAAAGGGGVIGEIAAPTWDELPRKLASFKPDVVAYQITTYDWGTAAEQRTGYERLAKTVHDAGADLLIVSAPPFKIDDFYKPNETAIKTAPRSAREVAEKNPDTVHFLDASALWGPDGAAAKAQRSKDGIHSCQQGSAAFATWFGKKLNLRYGFTPASPNQWATGSWTGDKVYGPLGCA